MCFDLDSRPPIAPIAGGALDSERIVLAADDGNRFLAFRARAARPTGAGILILPDVRGLHRYYEELALRFAEAGLHALAIDYFGRTAGTHTLRDESFDFKPHVEGTTWAGLTADIRAGVESLKSAEGGAARTLFTIGFCFGGRIAFVTPTIGLDLAGAIGFYGRPTGTSANGTPVPVEVAGLSKGAVLGLFGGADPGIRSEAVAEYQAALAAAGIDHRIVTYEGAPHSFFDRKAADFAEASDAAWAEITAFIESKGSTHPR